MWEDISTFEKRKIGNHHQSCLMVLLDGYRVPLDRTVYGTPSITTTFFCCIATIVIVVWCDVLGPLYKYNKYYRLDNNYYTPVRGYRFPSLKGWSFACRWKSSHSGACCEVDANAIFWVAASSIRVRQRPTAYKNRRFMLRIPLHGHSVALRAGAHPLPTAAPNASNTRTRRNTCKFLKHFLLLSQYFWAVLGKFRVITWL